MSNPLSRDLRTKPKIAAELTEGRIVKQEGLKRETTQIKKMYMVAKKPSEPTN